VRPILLDTNVLSELVRPRPDPRVAAFVGGVASPLISVLTLHELTFGAAHSHDPARRERLMAWIDTVRRRFEGRMIDVDADTAEIAGRLRAVAGLTGRQTDPIDALIAASALVRDAAVATRNVRDFEALGVDLIDPSVA
jgi:toxin FitB